MADKPVRSLLIYNPASGTARNRRKAVIDQIVRLLQGHGFALTVVATTHRGSAALQVRQAVNEGVQVVFACGGDGTIHDVLQGIAGTTTRLAPIPLGSANALCRDLGIPLHPLRAAAAYRNTLEREVFAGQCETSSGKRYFLLMAGAGPDGALVYRMLTTKRDSLGRWAYATHALRLLLRGRFSSFHVRYQTVDGTWHEADAVSAIALRIGNLGGIFPGVSHGASLDGRSMRLILVHAPAVLGLPLWFVSSWLRLERWNSLLVQQDVTAFECVGDDVHAQTDGEWVGPLPITVTLTQQHVRLLLPAAL